MSRKPATKPDPTRKVRTNVETWRKKAIQIVTVRHGSSGGIHATIQATIATPEAATLFIGELARCRPASERIYAFGPSEKGAITPKEACERAIADYANGGLRGFPGELL